MTREYYIIENIAFHELENMQLKHQLIHQQALMQA